MAGQLILLLGVAVAGAFALRTPDLSGAWRAVTIGAGAVLLALAGILLARGFRALGPNLSAVPRPRPGGEMVETGLYRRIRHPIYAGVICLAAGWSLAAGSFLAMGIALTLAVWLDLKARREEAWLVEHYPAYAGYVARSRRFVPGIY